MEYGGVATAVAEVGFTTHFASDWDAATYAVDVMRTADTDGDIETIVAGQHRAEAAFRERAYAAWPSFPDHPAAPALGALARRPAGEDIDVSRIRGLAWLGKLLREHEPDWSDRRSQVASRLRAPDNFRGCVFELEASRLFRMTGHRTRWLWPTADTEGDVLIDDEIYVECVAVPPRAGVRIPHDLGAQVASAVLTAMQRLKYQVHVAVAVEATLPPSDLPMLRDRIVDAIRGRTTGRLVPAMRGYDVQITELAPHDQSLTDDEIADLQARRSASDQAWGDIGRNAAGQPANARLVTMSAIAAEDAIGALVRAAVRKRHQMKTGRINVVCAKFGHPVPFGQVVNPVVRNAIGDRAVRALREVASGAISGLVLYFDTGVLYPLPSLGITERESDPSEPMSVAIGVRNPIATTPVPDTL